MTHDWLIAFTSLEIRAVEFLIHGAYGDYIEELLTLAKILGIEVRIFR